MGCGHAACCPAITAASSTLRFLERRNESITTQNGYSQSTLLTPYRSHNCSSVDYSVLLGADLTPVPFLECVDLQRYLIYQAFEVHGYTHKENSPHDFVDSLSPRHVAFHVARKCLRCHTLRRSKDRCAASILCSNLPPSR